MRKTCLKCVRKHLGTAAAYINEIMQGYPNLDIFAIGELTHASLECLLLYPDLAWAIREHRIRWSLTQDGKNPHIIPFEAINDYLHVLEQANAPVAIPDEVLDGLPRNEAGEVVYSMDTRP